MPRRGRGGGRAGAALRGRQGGDRLRRRIEVAEAADAFGRRSGRASAPAWHPGACSMRRGSAPTCTIICWCGSCSPPRTSGAPQIDTGHAGIAYQRSNASLPGPDIQVFGRHERAERAGPAARHGLSHHARPDEAEEPRHGAARVGRSDRRRCWSIRNYFAEQADVDAYVAGIEFAMAIGNGKGFDARAQGAGQHSRRQQGADRRVRPRQRRDLFPLRRHLRHGQGRVGAGRRDAARARRRTSCASRTPR